MRKIRPQVPQKISSRMALERTELTYKRLLETAHKMIWPICRISPRNIAKNLCTAGASAEAEGVKGMGNYEGIPESRLEK
jgi:hypothetical protein